MICIGHKQLVSSDGVGRFIVFKSLHRKKCDRWGGGKPFSTSMEYLTQMLAKTTPPASREGREVLRFFCCLHFQGALFVPVDRSCSDGKIQLSSD